MLLPRTKHVVLAHLEVHLSMSSIVFSQSILSRIACKLIDITLFLASNPQLGLPVKSGNTYHTCHEMYLLQLNPL
jgi:hypothetical protein